MGFESNLQIEQNEQKQIFNYTNKQAQNNLKNARTAETCGDTLLEKAEALKEIDEEKHKENCKGSLGRYEEAIEKKMKSAAEAIGVGKNTYKNDDPREGKCGDNVEIRRSHNVTEINKVLKENNINLLKDAEAREVNHMLTEDQLTNTAVDNNADIEVSFEQAKRMKDILETVNSNFQQYVNQEDTRRSENKKRKERIKNTRKAFENVEIPSWLKY